MLPGTGPIASVVLAVVFRVNKIAALTASLLTNFWFSIVAFVVAVRVGSVLTGVDWHTVYDRCEAVIRHFSWKELSSIPFSEVIVPFFVGYAVVGLVSGAIAYVIVLFIFKQRQKFRSHS